MYDLQLRQWEYLDFSVRPSAGFYHSQKGVEMGYLLKTRDRVVGSGDQTVVFGRLHDGPPAMHTQLVTDISDMDVDGPHGDR